MKEIDLRSDTVTLPTKEMRDAIYGADLGDDVYGEDPATNELQKIASDILGKEDSILIPSGSMGNLAAVLTHCNRGEEIILGDLSHIFLNEGGGVSALGGIHPHTLPNQRDGTIKLKDIESAIRRPDIHHPLTKLVCLENTHNRCNGAPLTPEYMKKVADICRKNELLLHVDGARLFNAAVSLKVDVKSLTEHADSVMVCLSKGLSAPVGSILCGDSEFIRKARRTRKLLGGGMRQCGIISAAGIVSLNNFEDTIKEDHKNAKLLAEGISQIDGIEIDPSLVKTNILYFELTDLEPQKFYKKLGKMGLKVLKTGKNKFRMVTHREIDEKKIKESISIIKRAVKQAD